MITPGVYTPQFKYVVKTSDESCASDTSLNNDSVLLIPVEANSAYIGKVFIRLTGNNVASAKLGWSYPVGCAINWGLCAVAFGATAQKIETDVAILSMTATVNNHLVYHFVIANGANAGNVNLMWCQSNSSATPTIMKAGSYLEYRKV